MNYSLTALKPTVVIIEINSCVVVGLSPLQAQLGQRDANIYYIGTVPWTSK